MEKYTLYTREHSYFVRPWFDDEKTFETLDEAKEKMDSLEHVARDHQVTMRLNNSEGDTIETRQLEKNTGN